MLDNKFGRRRLISEKRERLSTQVRNIVCCFNPRIILSPGWRGLCRPYNLGIINICFILLLRNLCFITTVSQLFFSLIQTIYFCAFLSKVLLFFLTLLLSLLSVSDVISITSLATSALSLFTVLMFYELHTCLDGLEIIDFVSCF